MRVVARLIDKKAYDLAVKRLCSNDPHTIQATQAISGTMTSSLRLTCAVLVLFSGAAIHLLDVLTAWYGSAWMEEWVQLGTAILSFVAGLWVLQLLLRNSRTCQAIAERARFQRQLTPLQRARDTALAMMSEGEMRTAGDSFIRRPQPLQILLADILIKEQRERRRLAENVNDTLMQLLAVSLMKIKHAQLVRGEPRDIPPDLERLLTQSLQHSRRLIRELSPTALLPAQLPTVFRRLADQMRDHGLIVTVEYAEKDLPVCPDLSMVIYQTMSELLFNVVKHAHTARAVVTIEKRHDCDLTVTVRDHGEGFDTESLGASAIEQHKFGLFSIQEQLAALGGRLSIESTIGAGTSVTVVIPQTACGKK